MDDKFNGLPSIVLDHRPFFSIVVACYNSGPYLSTLLQSIVDQHMNDDIEVILSDDCSTESYDNVVERFNKILCIKRVKTDYNFAPSNTRQKGISVATGRWLNFADHDDQFIPDTLRRVKDTIIAKQEPYYAVGDFEELEPISKKVVRHFQRPLGWCHAKFFNLDNTWKKFNVSFEKNLRSHEDIYICSQLNCIMAHLNRTPLYLDFPCYIWYARQNSLSRSKYKEKTKEVPFFEHFFDDYLHVTADVYFEKYKEGMISEKLALEYEVEMVAYSYFYMMGFMFHNPDYVKSNLLLCKKLIKKTKDMFNVTDDDIYNILAQDDAKLYKQIEMSASIGAGPYIPCMTLKEYLHTYG